MSTAETAAPRRPPPGPAAAGTVRPGFTADPPAGHGPGARPTPSWGWRVLAIPLFFWSLPALLSTRAMMESSGGRITFWRAITVEGLPWYLWVLLTPVILAMTRRFPVDRPPRARNIGLHVVTGLLMGVASGSVWYGLWTSLARGLDGRAQPENLSLGVAILFWAVFGLLFYAATASVGFALDYHRKLREREVAASRLEGQLLEERLSALRMQLQPHFLFNALNTVSMLVRQGEASTAVRVVARLSDLLRYVLESGDGPMVPLREEIDVAAQYLEIEQLRFGDRLAVDIDVDAVAGAVPVPGLVLQPLVENAVRHGIAPRASAGRIRLAAGIRDGRLIIELSDDGPGFSFPPDEVDRQHGIGLRNTRARLAYAYGEAASLRLDNGREGGAVVTLELPLQAAPNGG